MNIRIKSFIIALIFGTASIVMSACASKQVNLLENGIVSFKYVPSKNIYVSKAYAYQDGNKLVISGKVKHRSGTSYTVGGHVDITVRNPDGAILKQVGTTYVPRIIRRKGAQESSFTVRLPIIPPQGTAIHLGYHHTVDKTFHCKENVVISGSL